MSKKASKTSRKTRPQDMVIDNFLQFEDYPII